MKRGKANLGSSSSFLLGSWRHGTLGELPRKEPNASYFRSKTFFFHLIEIWE